MPAFMPPGGGAIPPPGGAALPWGALASPANSQLLPPTTAASSGKNPFDSPYVQPAGPGSFPSSEPADLQRNPFADGEDDADDLGMVLFRLT